jgi:HAD superfamily hydrolase (TIGR01484 family)
MTSLPQPIQKLSQAQARGLTHLLFDFDDTVTWQGQLPLEGIQAIYQAYEAGFHLIVVTGRSASWAEMLMRLFPFQAAIAETGALCYHRTHINGPISVLHTVESLSERQANSQQREHIAQNIMRDLPEVRFALDNPGRIYDSAFDLVEDGPPLPEETIKHIHRRLDEAQLQWAQSSVHINFFQGDFNKAAMVKRYFCELQKQDWNDIAPHLAYLGDSTNDGPLFKVVPISIGVANVEAFLPALNAKGQAPTYITRQNGGYGFAEAIDHLVTLKNA